MSIAKKTLLLVIGSLLIVGMISTVWDWRQWRIEETKNYGQGREANRDVAPARKLGGVYTNKILRFRIKYPQNWEVKGLTFSEPFGRIKMVVTVVKDERNFPIIADEAAAGVTQERGYINTESASIVILTWEGGDETKQIALAKRDNRLYKIEVTCGNGIWKSWSATSRDLPIFGFVVEMK